MSYEQIILDIIAPLVSVPERLKIVPMDQENLYETTYIIYCDEKDRGILDDDLIFFGAERVFEKINIYRKR